MTREYSNVEIFDETDHYNREFLEKTPFTDPQIQALIHRIVIGAPGGSLCALRYHYLIDNKIIPRNGEDFAEEKRISVYEIRQRFSEFCTQLGVDKRNNIYSKLYYLLIPKDWGRIAKFFLVQQSNILLNYDLADIYLTYVKDKVLELVKPWDENPEGHFRKAFGSKDNFKRIIDTFIGTLPQLFHSVEA